MSNYLGAAIRARREALGYSQQCLAEKAGVGRAWLSTVETGDATNPGAAKLGRVAQALGVRVDDLLNENSTNHILLASHLADAYQSTGALLGLLAIMHPDAPGDHNQRLAVVGRAFKTFRDNLNAEGQLDPHAPINFAQFTVEVIEAIRAAGEAPIEDDD